jgi:hypothetical protein
MWLILEVAESGLFSGNRGLKLPRCSRLDFWSIALPVHLFTCDPPLSLRCTELQLTQRRHPGFVLRRREGNLTFLPGSSHFDSITSILESLISGSVGITLCSEAHVLYCRVRWTYYTSFFDVEINIQDFDVVWASGFGL